MIKVFLLNLKGYDLEDLDSVIKILNGMYYQDEENFHFRKIFLEKNIKTILRN